MKRIIILITLMVFGSKIAMSQAKVRPGIKVGVNYSTISNLDMDREWGLLIGALVHIDFSEFYTMQPEILYSRQGGKSTRPELESVAIDYITVGLSNKFFVKDTNFHFLVGSSLDFDFDDNFARLINDGFDDDVFFFDFAFFGGVGYEFDVGLMLEARYKHGTIEVFTSDFFSANENQLNDLFQFSLAYKFDF